MHRQQAQVDDARGVCIHCNKPIHQSKRDKKWFHIHDFSSFCTGMASCKTEAAPTTK